MHESICDSNFQPCWTLVVIDPSLIVPKSIQMQSIHKTRREKTLVCKKVADDAVDFNSGSCVRSELFLGSKL